MSLNPFHTTLQQAHATAECAEQRSQVGLVGGAAGELQTQHHRCIRRWWLRLQTALQFLRQGVLQRRKQGLADFVLRVAKHFPDRALLDDVSMLQHHDAVADVADHRHLVGDQHDGQAQALIDLAQQAEDRLGGLRVQCRGGFVAQQNLRVVHQCPGDADSLFLPPDNCAG